MDDDEEADDLLSDSFDDSDSGESYHQLKAKSNSNPSLEHLS